MPAPRSKAAKTVATPPPSQGRIASIPPLPVTDAEAQRLVEELMAIPGRSGEEGRVAAFVSARLAEAGLDPLLLGADQAGRRSALRGEVGNLILKLPGRGPRRMLVAHLDTVPICVGSRPRRKGGMLASGDPKTGLGADNRAGVAVLLSTALGLLRSGLSGPPITLLWTVQEEVGLHGARLVSVPMLGRPRLAFNFDGATPTRLTVGATGGYRMTIEVDGIASHAGVAPQAGVSAIAIASLAIADLVQHGWLGLVNKGRLSGTSNVGVIHGGEATNVVTELVTLRAEARSHDPAFRQRIVQEIGDAFERAAKQVANTEGRCGAVRIQGQLDYESFRLADDNPSVVAARDTILALGHEPMLAVANGGLDANWLSARGIPTVTLGCGQRNIHTVSEQLDLADFHLARQIAWRLALGAGAQPHEASPA